MNTENGSTPTNFIRNIVIKDLESGKHDRIVTRFPPEPNGYLHIGHAKSILLNYGLAEKFGGKFNLRFDDTNPTREEQEYVDSIQRDVRWLGFDWEDRLYYASDYFEQLYDWAELLITKGLAYVDEQDGDSGESDVVSLLNRQSDEFLQWWADPETEVASRLLGEQILAAIDELPEAFREAILLVNVHGLRYDEAAEVLGVPSGTIRSRMKRGRTLLQKALWVQARDAGLIPDGEETK